MYIYTFHQDAMEMIRCSVYDMKAVSGEAVRDNSWRVRESAPGLRGANIDSLSRETREHRSGSAVQYAVDRRHNKWFVEDVKLHEKRPHKTSRSWNLYERFFWINWLRMMKL